MPIYTVREFAELTGVKPKDIHSYFSSGRLVKSPDKKVDTSDPKNALFFEQKAKKVSEPVDSKPKRRRVKSSAKNEDKESLTDLEIKKQKLSLEKLEHEIQLKGIELEKKRGYLVPVDAVKDVFLFSLETFRSKYLQEAKSKAEISVQIMGGSHNDIIRMQKELSESINEAHSEAKKQLIEGIDSVVEDYKDIRGRGEKK
jgi:hypothetical protein